MASKKLKVPKIKLKKTKTYKQILRRKKIVNNIFRTFSVLAILLCVSSIALFANEKGVKLKLPHIPSKVNFAIVRTGSMIPTIPVGTLIVTVKEEEYVEGDIVRFYEVSGKNTYTHRIYEETSEGFVTKGDNNNAPDADILTEDRIIGKVITQLIPAGKIIGKLSLIIKMFLQTVPIYVSLPAIVFFCLIFYYLTEKAKELMR